MATTVLEALLNAQTNFETSKILPGLFPIAMEQLDNAIEALENGMAANDVIQETLLDDVKTKPIEE